jgi:transposase
MINVGKTVKVRLWGILNAVQLRTTNSIAKSSNMTIQKIKGRACGFRNRARFRTAILFHKEGLSLMPAGICEVYPH